jgi:hypothetical protein
MTDIRDDPEFFFLMCAAVAYAQVAAETGQMPPDSERTRRRAYSLYEAVKAR